MRNKKSLFVSLGVVLSAIASFGALKAVTKQNTVKETSAIAENEIPTVLYANMDRSPWPGWGAGYTTDTGDGAHNSLRMHAWCDDDSIKTDFWHNVPTEIETVGGRKFAKFDLNNLSTGNISFEQIKYIQFVAFGENNDNKTKPISFPLQAGKDIVYILSGSDDGYKTYYFADYTFAELKASVNNEDESIDKTIQLHDVSGVYDSTPKIFTWGSLNVGGWAGPDMNVVNANYHGGALYSYTHTASAHTEDISLVFNNGGDGKKTADIVCNAVKLMYVLKSCEGNGTSEGKWYSKTGHAAGMDFIYTIMKMDDSNYEGDISTANCASNYSAAKTAFASLSTEAKELVDYIKADTWTRLSKWAIANGEVFNRAAGTFSSNSNILAINNGGSLTIITIVSAISLIALASFFLLRKKKENK